MRSSLLLVTLYCLAVPTSAWSWGKGDKKKKEAEAATDGEEPEEPFEGLSPVSMSADGIPMVSLHNDLLMPLVGLGVEYLQPYLVPLLSASALQQDKKTRLFDTAHVTGNEALLATGIQQGLERIQLEEGEKLELHVVTKVWYTHLGYHRTQISVKESMERLMGSVAKDDRVDLKVHILLQWPRCYETIDWMNCELDEDSAPSHVQEAGPPPHQDKDNAWKGSWKALEDMYLAQAPETPIASIGVANFHLKDLQEMDRMGDEIRVHPHILQLSVWSLLYDPMLVDYCTQRGIHVQVVDAIDGILADPSRTKNAHHHLLKASEDLEDGLLYDIDQDELTPTQVVLTWLIQQGVSIIPGPERLSELQENSAVALAAMPPLKHLQVRTVAHCVEAFLSGEDLEKDIHTFVTFTAKSKDAMLYWQRPDGGESKIAFIGKGKSFNETTYPKHHFRIYDARNKDNFIDYHVEAKFGEEVSFDAYLD